MNDRRAAILEGRKSAAQLHRELALQAAAEELGRIDVFSAISALDIPCLCKPLTGLLGAYLPPPHDGVIVTSQRPRAIQRLTAAHELGHRTMKHKLSLDSEDVIGRATANPEDFDPQEVAADAFASAFLAPQWLIMRHARRQSWKVDDFRNPEIVYQLSLRLGLTFRATGVALVQTSILTWPDYHQLRANDVKDIKRSIGGPSALSEWKYDVWRVSEVDADERVEATPGDVMLLELAEHASAGYLWEGLDGSASAFQAESEILPNEVGGESQRSMRFLATEGISHVKLTEKRPWEKEPRETFEFEIQPAPPESGLPRAARARL